MIELFLFFSLNLMFIYHPYMTHFFPATPTIVSLYEHQHLL